MKIFASGHRPRTGRGFRAFELCIAELGNESFNLAYLNGKEIKENPVSLKMKDQTNNEDVEDQWYFKKRNL